MTKHALRIHTIDFNKNSNISTVIFNVKMVTLELFLRVNYTNLSLG